MNPTAFYAPAEIAPGGSWRRSASVLAVLALHLLLVVLIAYAAVRPELPPPVKALAVRMLELSPPAPPKIEPPKPLPQQARPKKPLAPPPVMTSAAQEASPAFAVAPQPAPIAAPVPAPPAPAPITAARFDADYLQNPKPVYPPMSRRMGEEGKVVLRVRVSAQGLPLAIEIRQSSGHVRLDEAARSAVERWRFVPARQGDEPIESSVLVPLNFTLGG